MARVRRERLKRAGKTFRPDANRWETSPGTPALPPAVADCNVPASSCSGAVQISRHAHFSCRLTCGSNAAKGALHDHQINLLCFPTAQPRLPRSTELLDYLRVLAIIVGIAVPSRYSANKARKSRRAADARNAQPGFLAGRGEERFLSISHPPPKTARRTWGIRHSQSP